MIGSHLSEWLPAEEIGDLYRAATDVIDLHGLRVQVAGGRTPNCEGDFGGPRSYDIADGINAETGVYGIAGIREGALVAAIHATGLPLVESPHPRSGTVLKRFWQGDSQGWHRDSNPVTALVYLTGGPRRGGELIVLDAVQAAGPPLIVEPHAGDLVILLGRVNPHAVLRHAAFLPRVVIGFNLYLAGDTDRPASADGIVFGGAP